MSIKFPRTRLFKADNDRDKAPFAAVHLPLLAQTLTFSLSLSLSRAPIRLREPISKALLDFSWKSASLHSIPRVCRSTRSVIIRGNERNARHAPRSINKFDHRPGLDYLFGGRGKKKKKEEKRRKDGREKKLHTPRRADAMRWWFVAMVVVVVVNEAHRRKRMTFKRTRLYVYQIISVLHDLIDRDGNGARRNLNWFSTHLSL